MSDLESQARQAYEKYKFSDMINQSIDVLTHPSVATFEKYEKAGSVRQSFIYVGAAAVLAGIVSFLVALIWVGPVAAVLALVGSVVSTIAGYAAFAYVVHYVGKTQGGTGTQDEVFYSAALYVAPLLAVGGVLGLLVGLIPPLVCVAFWVPLALLVYQAYLGYLMTRSSMNLAQQPAIITVIAAFVANLIVSVVVNQIF